MDCYETRRDAPFDILRSLFPEILVKGRSATQELRPVMVGRQRLAAKRGHHLHFAVTLRSVRVQYLGNYEFHNSGTGEIWKYDDYGQLYLKKKLVKLGDPLVIEK
jgi:hypothetical protein